MIKSLSTTHVYLDVNINKHFAASTLTNHYRDQENEQNDPLLTQTPAMWSKLQITETDWEKHFLEVICYSMWSFFLFLVFRGIASVERIPFPWKTGTITLRTDIRYLSPPSFCAQIEL